MDHFARHRKQNLPRAPQRAEAAKDLTDHFLQPQIRGEHDTGIKVPDIADRRPVAQLSATGLGPCGFQHPRPQDPKLELADASLHAQKKPVIGVARVVDTVMIHDPGINQTTQLQHVVPVPPVACQPRDLQTEDGPNRTGTQHGNQSFEPGPGLTSAG